MNALTSSYQLQASWSDVNIMEVIRIICIFTHSCPCLSVFTRKAQIEKGHVMATNQADVIVISAF